jgi:drug/metabolite transporter (DMT)-like permease
MDDTNQRWLGGLLIIASAGAFSLAGFFTRLIALDPWTMLFWRGLFGGLFIGGFIVWQHRGATLAAVRAIGGAGLLAAACSTVATICFINALRRTTVADVMVINATIPFFAAAFAWLWTGERESRATLLASVAALIGVALTFDVTVSAGQLLGNLLALVMTILIAIMMVIIRQRRDVSMLPAASLSAFALPLVVWPLASPRAGLGPDLIYLVLFGTVQFGLGLLLLTLGTRLISATRSALIGSLETPLAPLWVWLAFGETPSLMTCLGGAIVLAAVVADVVLNKASRNGTNATARRSGFVTRPGSARIRRLYRSSLPPHWWRTLAPGTAPQQGRPR